MKKNLAFIITFLMLTSFVKSQDFEKIKKKLENPEHGKYQPYQSIKGYPLTTFYKPLATNYVEEIRNKIIDTAFKNTFYNIYKNTIYPQAQLSFNSSTDLNGAKNTTGIAANSYYAKHAAFVYLMGFNGEGEYLRSSQDTLKIAELYAIRTNALERLYNIEYKTDSDEKLQYRSKELIHYLQAYDYLKAAGVVSDSLEVAKYKLQIFARNICKKNSVFKKDDNHSIMSASAIGLAAIVLNDCGYKNKSHDNYKPDEWIDVAMFTIEETLWEAKHPMSTRGSISGYAEGPHYFGYAFENAVPFFIAFNNYFQTDFSSKYKYKGDEHTVRNFLYDPDIENLGIWLKDITQPDGKPAAYDDCRIFRVYPYFLAILKTFGNDTKHTDFNIMTPNNTVNVYLQADYLANAPDIPKYPLKADVSHAHKVSGDLILRSPYSVPVINSHFIRIAGEIGTALNDGQSETYGHEHPDVSSFIITAGNEIIAMDPGYIRYELRNSTNKAHHHNLIMVDRWWIFGEKGPENNTPATDMGDILKTSSLQKSYIKTEYVHTKFERNIEMYKIDNEHYYYVMSDFVDRNRDSVQREFIWCLNGNGNYEKGTFKLYPDGNCLWTHPCSVRGAVPGTWNLASITAVKGSPDNIDSSSTDTYNDNAGDYLSNKDSLYYWDGLTRKTAYCGKHTRLEVTKNGNEVTFLSVFWPYKCSETPPTMSKTETDDYACVTINNFNGNDVFHHAKLSNTTVLHLNPYNFTNCNAVLSYDAESAMLKKSRSNSINFGNCTSNTNFRIAAIDNGTFLTYHDTIYISTSQNINTAYEITGRYKYQGFIENNTGGDIDVTYFLPDCEPQYDMQAVSLKQNLLPYSYNNGEKKITITFPSGITNFEIKLTDPCLASCFFPPVAIDTLFEFNTGTTEQLGHNLDINEPYGHLKITNGSKMEICPEMVMVNHDSITMLGLYEKYDESLPLYTQYAENGDAVLDSSGKKVDDRFGSRKSMIIIKQDAGLVLLPNSHTHIGANSTILVKKGGTLLIQENAHIEIGSPEQPGYGEIIAEDGAYVCINQNADIHFYNNPADSSDKNIFYVFNPLGDTIYLIGGGIKTTGAIAGVNPNGNYSRFGSTNCTGFCDFKNYSPPHGINNRDFGWANINYPVAVAQMVDTFCFGSDVTVKAKRTLNETKWHFEICEYDGANCVSPVTYVPFKGYDTVRIGEYNLSDEFNFEEGKLYKIRFVAENDCHETNLVDNLVYISSLPYAAFDIPVEVCPGSGTLLATNGQNSANEYKYKWSVSMLGQDNYHPDDEDAYYHEKTYSYNGQVQDSFNFPDFRFYGNRKYEVELSVYGYCGVATKTDTVNVPYGVYLEPDEATIYFDGFGDTSVLLNGSVYGFSTYNWNPTTYLSNPAILHPVSYPTSPVTYILSASGNGCSDADTLSITVNYYANAGSDKIICKGDSIILGFSGKSIPSTMYIDWKPTANMDDSTIVNPTVFPSVTTNYTMNIRLKSNNSLIESDEVTVYVDSAVSPSFLTNEYLIAEDSIILYFENSSEPYLPTTTYSWTFGDGSDTSHLINIYHTFYKQTVDTFFVVCLKTTTSCSDSTYCDTVFYKADSNEWEFWIPEIATVEELITVDNSYLIGNIPNPFKDQTTIKYHLAENSGSAEIVIYNLFGKHVKTIRLRPHSDTYSLDWSAFAKGIYSYSLLIDGILKDSKKMIKL